MNIDKPTIKEPTIPDSPLGAPPLQEVQGDPRLMLGMEEAEEGGGLGMGPREDLGETKGR